MQIELVLGFIGGLLLSVVIYLIGGWLALAWNPMNLIDWIRRRA